MQAVILLKYFRRMDATNGVGSSLIYNGTNGDCFNAITGDPLDPGSLVSSGSGVAAIAYDKTSNRIYFVNNTASSPQDLSYIDLNASPVCARSYAGYPLETHKPAPRRLPAFIRMGYCLYEI